MPEEIKVKAKLEGCSLQPLVAWVKEEDGFCRPCALPPVISWYQQELIERGKEALATELMSLIEKEGVTPEEVCETMDRIKTAVKEEDPELHTRLQEFDCHVQKYVEEAEAGEVEEE